MQRPPAPRKGWAPFRLEILSLAPSRLAFGHLVSGLDAVLCNCPRGHSWGRGGFSLSICTAAGLPWAGYRSAPFPMLLHFPTHWITGAALQTTDTWVPPAGNLTQWAGVRPGHRFFKALQVTLMCRGKYCLRSKLNRSGISRDQPSFSSICFHSYLWWKPTMSQTRS